MIMPFMGFKDFDSCVLAQKKKGKSDSAAHKICGYLQKKAEGQMSETEYNKAIAEMWMEDVLNSNKNEETK
jgi:hypothetical protein